MLNDNWGVVGFDCQGNDVDGGDQFFWEDVGEGDGGGNHFGHIGFVGIDGEYFWDVVSNDDEMEVLGGVGGGDEVEGEASNPVLLDFWLRD